MPAIKNEPHKWSNAEKEYLAKVAFGKTHNEILKLMNKKFEYQFTKMQISAAMRRYKIITGNDGRFKKGHVPCNKDTKGLLKANSGSFKKGHKPLNYRPIGSEKLGKDGYVKVKISDDVKWKNKHVLLWENEFGQVPKGHSVIFGDGDKTNFKLENLLLVSKKQLAVMNRNRMIQNDVELTKSSIQVAELMMTIARAKKRV